MFVSGFVHTNGIESVWALLKRQIVGIHHWVSNKHLNRYVAEMTWRFNRRDMKTTSRMNDLFACVRRTANLQGVDRMTGDDKLNKKFGLDISFGEALQRFANVTKEELEEAASDGDPGRDDSRGSIRDCTIQRNYYSQGISRKRMVVFGRRRLRSAHRFI